MAYLFKQKLLIGDLVDLELRPKRVLIHEPEEYLSALYGSYLRAHNFEVAHCPNLNLLIQTSADFLPDVLIFNLEAGQAKVLVAWLSKFSRSFPNISVITTGFNTDAEVLKNLMPTGLISHINRRLSKPQDIVEVVKALLNN